MFTFKPSLILTIGLVGISYSQVPVAKGAEFSVERESSGDISVYIDRQMFTRYVTSDDDSNKCYFWPVVGPSGSQFTRAFPMQDVLGEKQDHPHHRSICFGLESAGGFDTWHERLTFEKNGKVDPAKLPVIGRQVHTKVMKAEASGNSATLVVKCDVINPSGVCYMRQTREVHFHVAENGSRVMDVEIMLESAEASITILGKKDSGMTVRVAHSMCIDAGQGGRIVNNEGDTDGDAWGKRASWVDFHGPVDGKRMGIAMLNHPDSFRHPTPWHVRSYGLLTANPFALREVAGESESGDYELVRGQPITLKHRIIFHEGDEKEADIAEAWKTYLNKQ